MSVTRGASGPNRDGARKRGTRGREYDLPACPVTRKISFTSRAKARKGLERAAARAAKAVYKCPHCPYWHTTSRRAW